MDTKADQVVETGRRRCRQYSALFKADAVGACQQAGVSVAAVALARGLNATLLHRWVKVAETANAPIAIRPTVPSQELQGSTGFVPMMVPSSAVADPIRVQIRRKGRTVSIEWPASAAHECALLLCELIK